MTVSSSTSSVSYSGNGSTTVFSYTFKIFANSNLVVSLKNNTTGVSTTQTLTTDYTVSGAGSASGGNVTFVTAPPSGNTVIIRRVLPYTQETDYTENDPFPAASHEDALDKLTMLTQQNRDEDAIKLPDGDVTSGINNVVPNTADRADTVLAFDSTGNVTVQPLSTTTLNTSSTQQGFTGDGSTTAFTLASNPGAAGAGVSIYIDGVYQERDTYSINSTTLTFTEAPPNNASIEVLNYRVADIGTADANNVTYSPNGSGAVQTTVQTKLRESVSVKDFGAVGDGVTDDTTAIQAALDSGNVIHVPQGNYLFSSLNLPYSTTLRGDGPKNTILKSSATSGTAITFVDDPSVDGNFWNSLENLTLDATTARQAGTGDGIVIDCGDNTKTAFQAHILNVIVQNQPGVGVKYVQPEECHVVVVTQQNGGKGFLVTSPNSRGISNDFQIRALNNEDVAIDVDTNHSEFRSCEALVQGDSPVFTGILFDIDGFGNVITCPDIELNQNPSDANIQAMTGIDLRGSNNTVIGGFIGNCGTSVVIGGASNKVDRVRPTIFSTNATDPVSGSKGIELLSGTTNHHVEFSESGVSKIETEIDDSSDDSVIVRDGEVNGLGKVLTATTTWDPPSMGVGGMQVTTIAVTDASLGSPCIVGHTGLTSGIGGNNKVQLTGFTVNGTVFVQMKNESGSILNVPSGTLTVKVFES